MLLFASHYNFLFSDYFPFFSLSSLEGFFLKFFIFVFFFLQNGTHLQDVTLYFKAFNRDFFIDLSVNK